jgi:hypothetical protein
VTRRVQRLLASFASLALVMAALAAAAFASNWWATKRWTYTFPGAGSWTLAFSVFETYDVPVRLYLWSPSKDLRRTVRLRGSVVCSKASFSYEKERSFSFTTRLGTGALLPLPVKDPTSGHIDDVLPITTCSWDIAIDIVALKSQVHRLLITAALPYGRFSDEDPQQCAITLDTRAHVVSRACSFFRPGSTPLLYPGH